MKIIGKEPGKILPPKNPVLPVGEHLEVDLGTGPLLCIVRAIVPAGSIIDNAIADQNGQDRPTLLLRSKVYPFPVYVLETVDAPVKRRLVIPETVFRQQYRDKGTPIFKKDS